MKYREGDQDWRSECTGHTLVRGLIADVVSSSLVKSYLEANLTCIAISSKIEIVGMEYKTRLFVQSQDPCQVGVLVAYGKDIVSLSLDVGNHERSFHHCMKRCVLSKISLNLGSLYIQKQKRLSCSGLMSPTSNLSIFRRSP